jgi:hypothetical protein
MQRQRHVELQSTLTCPKCGYQAIELMPDNACMHFYNCQGCARD